MKRFLTKREVIDLFRTTVLPGIRLKYEQDGKIDKVARREEWNNFTNMLNEDGLLSDYAYDNWAYPY